MPFVKLDTKILNSTTWLDPDACKVFITALLLAEPYEVRSPMATINVHDTSPAAFIVPVGWYGFVPAAGPGIVHQALIELSAGLAALERLASPDPGSRTPDHDGRRLVRVTGGFLVLNYIAYRDKDHSAAERQSRFRARQKMLRSNGVIVTTVTHADADADVKAIKQELKAPAEPADFRADLFSRWKSLPDGGGGAFLTKMFREHKPEQRVLEAVERALGETRADPKGFLIGVLRKEAAVDDAHDRLMAGVR